MPWAPLWGVLFFAMLLVLGIDSAFAVIEANIAGFEELTHKPNREKWAKWLCIMGFIGGLPFVTRSGYSVGHCRSMWRGVLS